jgi:hypothetical protein
LIHGKIFEAGDQNRNRSQAQAAQKDARSRIPTVSLPTPRQAADRMPKPHPFQPQRGRAFDSRFFH